MSALAAHPSERPAETPLELEGLCARAGAFELLHDLTLAVPRGALVALVGDTGAASSLALRVALGLVRPAGGRVRPFVFLAR